MRDPKQSGRRFWTLGLVLCVVGPLLCLSGCRSKARTDTGQADLAKKQQETQKQMMKEMMKNKGGPGGAR